jgi:hypothetical protein
VDVYIHIFLTSALFGCEWSASCPDRFTQEESAPSTHWIGGWVDPRACLDDVEKRKFFTLPGLELRLLGRPARSQSQYRLHYPGYFYMYGVKIIYDSLQICSAISISVLDFFVQRHIYVCNK